MSVIVSILSNQTITSSGSAIFENDHAQEMVLFWNIQGPITGTLPTIQFSLQEIDPNDRVSPIGQLVASSTINTTGTGQITLSLGMSSLISIIWTVGGTSPSFGGVYAAGISRDIGNIIGVVQPANNTQAIIVKPYSSTTNTTSVAASASNVTLLSQNSNRRGATIWNDSTTATLYVKLGVTASTTSYTAQVFPSGYYEIPYGYTGEIDGIWSSASGAARINELT
jgi:hypothetical protein